MPPVAAYHVIITAYGFWLPNDPQHDIAHRFAANLVLGRQRYPDEQTTPWG